MKKGEILCVAGLVGAGRTEIFKCVFGITEKEPGGQTFIEGKEVNIHSPGDAIKQGLGFLTEERRKSGFVPVFSICHNLTLCMLDKLPGGALINKKSEDEIA